MADYNFTTIILIVILVVLAYFVGQKVGAMLRDRYWQKEVENIRKDAVKRSRAVLGGQFSEQLAPFLPDFKFNPTECRFLGKPIDFVVFPGMDGKEITEVVFVEVKSGTSSLSTVERQLRDVIKEKKVSWSEYRIPEGVTEEKKEDS
ncbi:MAG: Holliday junction resolvase-like protein [Nanoarchaeota archaeon]|nr:Holliday junction resolvase-like protein [Nanoarchaeota archaeon]